MLKALTVSAVVLAALLGCGSNKVKRLSVVPAVGKVTLKSKALAGASLFLHPVDKTGRSCSAVTDDAGSFELWTNGRSGAVPGKYKVTVLSYAKRDGTPLVITDEDRANGVDAEQLIVSGQAKLTVPLKYVNLETTPLLIEVEEADGEPLQLALQ